MYPWAVARVGWGSLVPALALGWVGLDEGGLVPALALGWVGLDEGGLVPVSTRTRLGGAG